MLLLKTGPWSHFDTTLITFSAAIYLALCRSYPLKACCCKHIRNHILHIALLFVVYGGGGGGGFFLHMSIMPGGRYFLLSQSLTVIFFFCKVEISSPTPVPFFNLDLKHQMVLNGSVSWDDWPSGPWQVVCQLISLICSHTMPGQHSQPTLTQGCTRVWV